MAGRDTKKLATTYQWQKANANISGSTDTLLKLWNNATSVSGNYRVIASNGVCKDTSANVAVLINPIPKVGYTVNNLAQCLKGNKFIITDTTKLASGSYSALYTYSNGSKDTNKTHQKIFTSVNTYTLKQTITTNKGCKDSVTKSLTIYPNTTVGFTTNDTDQCKNGNSFTFTNTSSLSSGTFSNAWLYGNSNTSSGTNGSQSYASNGTYNVSLITTTNNSCKDTLTKKVIVFASPIAKYTYNDSDQCIKGNNFVFTNTSSIATGSNSYTWSFGDNTTSSSTSPSKKYGGVNSFSVKLKAISNNNCTDSITKLMVVYPNTVVAYNINDTDQCKNGNSFTFANTSSLSSGTFTNAWQYGNGNTSSGSNGSQSYAAYGNYSVSLITTTNNNCKDTLTKKVIVFASPIAKFTYNDSDQCLKVNNFVFTNTTTISAGSNTYSWNFGDNTTSASTSPSKKYSTDNTYLVKLKAISNNNCLDSISKQMVVYPNILVGFNINDSDQCQKGNLFKYTNVSVGTRLYTSFWQYGNGNTGSLTNATTSYASSGNFNVTLITTTTDNCKDTLVKKIIVFASPILAFNVSDTDQCLRGNQFKFNNTSTIASGTLNYEWKFGDNTSSSITNPVKTYSNFNTYTVQLKGSSNNNCIDSISRKMLVYPMPSANYFVNDSDQCLPINQFVFTSNSSIPSGTFTNSWNFGDGNVSNAFNANKIYALSGSYIVRLISNSNLNCSDTFKKTISVFKKPVADFNLTINSLCQKQSVLKIADITTSAKSYSTQYDMGDGNTKTGANFSYSYATAGQYKILMTSKVKTGCEDTISKTITILASPTSVFSINNNPQCLRGNNVGFTNSSLPSGAGYQWKYGDGDSSANLQDAHHYKQFGIFNVRLIATHTNNCKDTLIKTLTINENPKAAFSINDSTQCVNTNNFVATNNSTISSGSLSATWSFGDNGTSTSVNANHRYTTAGNFNIRLIANSTLNCKDTLIKKVIVFAKPDATFTVTTIHQKVREFAAVNKKYPKYSWSFGDGFTGDSVKQQHTYASVNSYTSRLVVMDSNNCTDTTQQTFQLSSGLNQLNSNLNKASVYPNPTSDIANVHFELASDGFVKYHIYDVNGKLIYSFEKLNLAKGIYDYYFDFVKYDLSSGTYFFELETKTGKTTDKIVLSR